MECLRFDMNNQYSPGNGFDGHYWAGGYRGADGNTRWDSGAPFDFDDFVGNPGAEPYIHLTYVLMSLGDGSNSLPNGQMDTFYGPRQEISVSSWVVSWSLGRAKLTGCLSTSWPERESMWTPNLIAISGPEPMTRSFLTPGCLNRMIAWSPWTLDGGRDFPERILSSGWPVIVRRCRIVTPWP